MLITQQYKQNQNIGSLSSSVLKTANKISQENASLTLDLLQTLQENHNATMHTQQINSNAIQSLTNNLHSNLATQMEQVHGQNTLNTAVTANDLTRSLNDATRILNESLSDTEYHLKESLQSLNSRININSAEQKKVIYHESSLEREQTRSNFEYLKKDIRNTADDFELQNQMNFANTINSINKVGLNDALAHKDIQIGNHKNKYEIMLTATQNASIQQDDITKSTARLDHQIQNTELEDLKRKSLLSQQIIESELALIRKETAIISSIKKQTCKIKEQIELRASNSQNLIKKDEHHRLKDTLVSAEIDNVSYYPERPTQKPVPRPAHVCPTSENSCTHN